MTIKKDITFIIPHKGRFEMLRQTLLSISKQDYDINNIEVIVVSQTPETEHARLVDNNQLLITTIILPESMTISALRNHGVSIANGEYLAFLDADIYLSSNWIKTMLGILANDSHTIIASAIQECSNQPSALEKIRTCLSNLKFDTNVDFLPGRNLFLRKDNFLRIGGFPEHLITCEDYYFTDKAANLGNLYYTSEAQYQHLGEDKTYREMFFKEIWRGQSNLQSISGRKIKLKELPSLVAPLIITFSLFATMISLGLQNLYLSVVFFLFAFCLFMIYVFRVSKICNKAVNLSSIMFFYLIYFLARTIGTLAGLVKPIGADHK